MLPQSSPLKAAGLWLCLILCLVFIIYLPGLSNPFAAEDFYFLSAANTSFAESWQNMLLSNRVWVVGTVYRWLMFGLFQDTPAPYHLFSLVVHLVNMLLVYRLASALSESRFSGLLAAIFFGFYPRHHQTVAWMTANQVLVFTMFGLVSLYSFRKYLAEQRWGWFALASISAGLAVFTQEGAIALFPLLFVMELLFPGDRPLAARLRSASFYARYAVLLLIVLAFFWVSFGGARAYKLAAVETTAQEIEASGLSGDAYHMTGIGTNTLKEMGTYLTYALYPHIPLRSLDPDLRTMLFAGITGLAGLLLWWKSGPPLRFALIWVALAILPYVFFAPFGNADRYFYFASAGVALVFALLLRGLGRIPALHRQQIVPALSLIVVAAYVMGAVIEIEHCLAEWGEAGRAAETLCQDAVRLYSDPAPGDTLLFAGNLPARFGQAYIYNGGGIGPQLALYYDRPSVSIYQTTDPEVLAGLADAEPVENALSDIQIVLLDEDGLHVRTGTVSDLETLKPSTWFK